MEFSTKISKEDLGGQARNPVRLVHQAEENPDSQKQRTQPSAEDVGCEQNRLKWDPVQAASFKAIRVGLHHAMLLKYQIWSGT